MNTRPQPIATVKLRPSVTNNASKKSWNLVLEITNVVRNGNYTRVYEAINRKITTPIWDKKKKTTRGTYQPLRTANGVIQCESIIDQEACHYADKIRQKRQHELDLEILYEGYEEEISQKEAKKEMDVISYFRIVAQNRHPNSETSQYNWLLAAEKLNGFLRGKKLLLKDINMRIINDYRSYLLQMRNERYTTKRIQRVSPTTAARYFMFFRAVLHQAYNEGYLDIDIASRTVAIKKEVHMRDAFTADEIDRLAVAPCKDDVLKRAALFSCLTGLRLSDLRLLCWKHLKCVNGSWRLDFVQSKTSVSDYLPISGQAFDMCGVPKDGEELIFPTLNKTAYFKPALNKWLQAAGITRHMTFHCFRHTFATLQLESGTDIYTIKSMLGHTSVNTTMLYSHIVDKRKRNAVDSLFIDNLKITD